MEDKTSVGEQSEAVAKRQGSEVSVAMTLKLPPGLEMLNNKDLVVPRIAIAQDTSQVVKDGVVKRGQLYNTLTYDVYEDADHKPLVKFIPLLMKKPRIKWHENTKKGAEHMSQDGITATDGRKCETECPFSNGDGSPAHMWWTDNKGKQQPPTCTPYFNFLSIVHPFESIIPIAISFGSTSYTEGKRLATMALMTGAPLFGRMYAMTTKAVSNDQGDFFILQIKPLGTPGKEHLDLGGQLYQFVSGREFRVDMGEGAIDAEADQVPF